MGAVPQKTSENFIWDINGEDYWIINEDNSEQITDNKIFPNVRQNSI